MKNSFSALLFFFIMLPSILMAQVNIKVNSLPPFEAEKYVQPVSTWFGTYFNTGTYYDASVPELFGFKFSIIGLWSIVPDDQKSFNPDPRIEGISTSEPTATIFGNKSSYYLSNKGFFTYPAGLSLNSVPFGIYQIAGSLYNTELMLRFFPNSKFDNTTVGLWGFGIKHEISSYFQPVPVDISVQLLYNKFTFQFADDDPANFTDLKSSNFAFNVHASKTFMDMFVVYSGLQFETSTMDFTYYFDDPNELYPDLTKKNHSFSLNGDNHFRFTAGGAVKLGVFVFNLDVNFTTFTTFSSGLSLDF